MKRNKVEKIFTFLLVECAIAGILCLTIFCTKNVNKTTTPPEITHVTSREELDINTENNDQIKEEVEVIQEFVPTVNSVNIKMVGDCLIHKPLYLGAKQDDGTYNFDHMFANIKKDIQTADIAIINQETIFIEDETQYSTYPAFGSPTAVGDAEVLAGFDVIAHSTNHAMDKHSSGIIDTLNFWKTNYPDITVLGIHDREMDPDVKFINKNDIDFAFVNYTYGLNGLENYLSGKEYMVDLLSNTDIEETLKVAEENADITIAVLHVGDEYVYKPTEYAKKQIHRMINNGADIVLCAHPHVVQPYEILTTPEGNTGLVYYSLGNFVSAQDQIPRIIGGMADITITKTIYEDHEEITINDYLMTPLVTHMEYRYYTTYKLSEYTSELANRHYLQKDYPFTIDSLNETYNEIVGETSKKKIIIQEGVNLVEEENIQQTNE